MEELLTTRVSKVIKFKTRSMTVQSLELSLLDQIIFKEINGIGKNNNKLKSIKFTLKFHFQNGY